MAVTNTLDYHDTVTIMTAKCFIAPGSKSGATTFSITTLGIKTLSKMTFSILTFRTTSQ